jgi:hypothetical protein
MSDAIKDFLSTAGISDVTSARKVLDRELRALQKNGDLVLESDECLSGFSLELRVQRLFEAAGFAISEGRPGMEDFVVGPNEEDGKKDNLVLEVKSSRSAQPSLDDLRQLDDWVFDLSGEETARKKGLGGGPDVLAMSTGGMLSRPKRHPTPHKGILIFNGPISIPFADRPPQLLHPNQLEFAMKRNFCIIGLDRLTELLKSERQSVWETLHNTVGEYIERA